METAGFRVSVNTVQIYDVIFYITAIEWYQWTEPQEQGLMAEMIGLI